MSRKPEATFKASVHRHLPTGRTGVYVEGMANDYRGGTPDNYYEGDSGYLWVEWKFLQDIPPVIDLMDAKKQVKLSPLQQKWLGRAESNKINVAVIVGSKLGGMVLTCDEVHHWSDKITREEFEHNLLSRKELATWIQENVGRCLNSPL